MDMAQRIQAFARLGDKALDLSSQFEHVFWAGDLNYRLSFPNDAVRNRAPRCVWRCQQHFPGKHWLSQ
jgi:hypothetical protein